MGKVAQQISKFDELAEKVRHYRWLQGIADKYRDMIGLIEREKEFFTIEGFSYSARGDTKVFSINNHRTIPYRFIQDGLRLELLDIEMEMKNIEIELEGWL